MRAVVQRVRESSVSVDNEVKGEIGVGLLVLLGVEDSDGKEDVEWLANKICALRIFADEDGLMNRSVLDVCGEILVVSQFTLHASTKKGTRPSFIRAAKPDHAIPLYEAFCEATALLLNRPIKTGVFGAMMQVSLINDGPVTIIIDTKNKE